MSAVRAEAEAERVRAAAEDGEVQHRVARRIYFASPTAPPEDGLAARAPQAPVDRVHCAHRVLLSGVDLLERRPRAAPAAHVADREQPPDARLAGRIVDQDVRLLRRAVPRVDLGAELPRQVVVDPMQPHRDHPKAGFDDRTVLEPEAAQHLPFGYAFWVENLHHARGERGDAVFGEQEPRLLGRSQRFAVGEQGDADPVPLVEHERDLGRGLAGAEDDRRGVAREVALAENAIEQRLVVRVGIDPADVVDDLSVPRGHLDARLPVHHSGRKHHRLTSNCPSAVRLDDELVALAAGAHCLLLHLGDASSQLAAETLEDVLHDVLGADMEVRPFQQLAGSGVSTAIEQLDDFPTHDARVDADHVVDVVDVLRPAGLGGRPVAPDPCGPQRVLRRAEHGRAAADSAADYDDLEGFVHGSRPSLRVRSPFYDQLDEVSLHDDRGKPDLACARPGNVTPVWPAKRSKDVTPACNAQPERWSNPSPASTPRRPPQAGLALDRDTRGPDCATERKAARSSTLDGRLVIRLPPYPEVEHGTGQRRKGRRYPTGKDDRRRNRGREDPGRERGRQLPRHAVHLQPRGRAAAPGQARGEDQPGGIAAGPLFASGSRMPPWPPKSGAPEATAARRTSRTLMRLPRAALFLLPRVLRWDDSSLPGRERCRPFAAGSARTAARSPARDTTAPAGPSRAAHLQRQLSGLRQRAVDRSPHWDSAFVRRGLP